MVGMTTDLYWECECGNDFVHLKSELACARCGRTADESPDAIAHEVATLVGGVTKLVAEEWVVTQEDIDQGITHTVGERYTYYVDPQTKKVYRPKAGHTITGAALENHFEEVVIAGQPSGPEA